MELQPTIFVVHDDLGVSRALCSVGQLLDLPVSSMSSADMFLASYDPSQPGCLVLDVKMPGMTGLELQQKLADDGVPLPIVMISGHADVPIAVEAMRRGAVTVLEQPCRVDELTVHIRHAVQIDAKRREVLSRQAVIKSRFARLTSKEREVLDLVSSGKTNKEIAASLHLSIRAVEDRRSRVMRKLEVRTVVELLRFCDFLPKPQTHAFRHFPLAGDTQPAEEAGERC